MITGVSGARGKVGHDFTAESCLALAASFGRRDGRAVRGPVIIGRDTRPSGVMAARAVAAGLLAAGRPVVDLGVCPTPVVEFAVPLLAGSGAVIITASHNPAAWNGLKFLDRQGLFLSGRAGRLVYGRLNAPGRRITPSAECREINMLPRYLERVVSLVDARAVAAKRFRVAVDAVNGAAWQAAPALLEALGATVIPLHCEPSGAFRRPPEPRPENLAQLCRLVKAEKADLGLAFDPDGDRLCLVSEQGRALSEEFTLALCADHVLARRPAPLVVNLSTSMVIDWVGARHRVPVIRTRVGEYHVADRMLREKSAIGGEGNGGVIYPACHPGRDGLMAAALVLELLAAENIALSAAAARLPAFHLAKHKVPRPAVSAGVLARRLARAFPGVPADRRDGIRLSGDKWWLQVRFSNTEPILRLFAETTSPGETNALIRRARQCLVG